MTRKSEALGAATSRAMTTTDTASTVSDSIITRPDPACKPDLPLPPNTPVCSRADDPVLSHYRRLIYEAVEADTIWLRDIRIEQYNAAFEDWLYWLFWDAEAIRIAKEQQDDE